MSHPTQQTLAKWKRLVRYWKPERLWGQLVCYGTMVEEVTTISDSDGAGVILLGIHTLKAYIRKQKIIAAAALGGV